MVVLGRKGAYVEGGWRCKGEGGRRGATPAQAEAGARSGEGGTTGGFQQEEEGKEKVGLFMFQSTQLIVLTFNLFCDVLANTCSNIYFKYLVQEFAKYFTLFS